MCLEVREAHSSDETFSSIGFFAAQCGANGSCEVGNKKLQGEYG